MDCLCAAREGDAHSFAPRKPLGGASTSISRRNALLEPQLIAAAVITLTCVAALVRRRGRAVQNDDTEAWFDELAAEGFSRAQIREKLQVRAARL